MFNNFKILSFDITKNKLRKLKDIFDRLNLSSLEERLNKVVLPSIESQLVILKDSSDYVDRHRCGNPNWPQPQYPPTPPVPPQYPIDYQYTYIILHIHNPEGKEIGFLDPRTVTVNGYGLNVPHNTNIQMSVFVPTSSDLHNMRTAVILPFQQYLYTDGWTGESIFTFNYNGKIYTKHIVLPQYQTTIVEFNIPRIETTLTLDINEDIIVTQPGDANTYFAGGVPFDINIRYYIGPHNVVGNSRLQLICTPFNFQFQHQLTVISEPSPAYSGLISYCDTIKVVPINIQPRTDFNYWIVQSSTTGQFPRVKVIFGEGAGDNTLIAGGINGMSLIDTQYRWDLLQLILPFGFPTVNWITAYLNNPTSRNLNGTTIFHMSNVPYDLLGTSE